MENLSRLLAEKISQTPLNQDPCYHVQFEEFFPDDLYEEMLLQLPEDRFFVDLKHGDAIRPDGSSSRTRIILTPPIIAGFPREKRLFWNQLVAALRSEEVATAYRTLFADVLSARFHSDPEGVKLLPHIMLMRDLAGYRIGVHNDSWSKVITTQYYLPGDNARAYLGTQFFRREGGVDTMAKQIPFVRNGGYAFPIAENSWHGVAQMGEDEPPRYSLMLIYYVVPALPKRIQLAAKDFGQAIRARVLAAVRERRGS